MERLAARKVGKPCCRWPKKVPRSPELQILLGNAEAVPCFAQSLQPGLGVRIAVVGQEDAVALGRSPAHPAPQLVKLAETKAVRILHHHHRSVGHIHSHFNDGGCHQDLRLSRANSAMAASFPVPSFAREGGLPANPEIPAAVASPPKPGRPFQIPSPPSSTLGQTT